METTTTESIVKATPGPWYVDVDDRGFRRIRSAATASQPEFTVALPCAGAGMGADPIEANARLIAAAPTLLEAARKVRDSFHAGDEAFDVLDAAIAQAEGRS